MSTLEYILAHPRKNAVASVYPIGTIVDDLEVVRYSSTGDGTILFCKCKKCGREKSLPKYCLDKHRGTKHSACGKFLPNVDRHFRGIWSNMKTRIYNRNYVYFHRYGGRGLKCDYEFFVDFYDDMYQSYLEHVVKHGSDTSIDRIDNNRGYVRGNLRWATQAEQVANSTKMAMPFRAISPTGDVYFGRNQTEFARQFDLSDKQVNAVLNGRFASTQGWKFQFLTEYVEDKFHQIILKKEKCNDYRKGHENATE